MFKIKRLTAIMMLLLLCHAAPYAAESAKEQTPKTIIIEFLDGATPPKGQLDLKVGKCHLKIKKILSHKDTTLLHHKDLYIYEYEGDTDSLKNILENHLYTIARKNKINNDSAGTIKGLKPKPQDKGSGAYKKDNTKPASSYVKTVYEKDIQRVSSFCLNSKVEVTFKGKADRTAILNKYDIKFRKVYSVSKKTLYYLEASTVKQAVSIAEQLMKNDFVESLSLQMFRIGELHR